MHRYLALSVILGVFVIQAQTPLATVTGLATDPSGSAIVNAAIALTNKGTGVKLTTKTNEAGAYSLPNLPPGAYSLIAEAAGFKKIEVEDRKSTRLNSSHLGISYAVFCLKKQ